ncbi:MAG TPA: hypothetical protein VKK79_15835, partial [Candidatus Lokiarchaeia archaeon]|nr:hypothetical protein [Candidatus Lokiarchaeia archaeon]
MQANRVAILTILFLSVGFASALAVGCASPGGEDVRFVATNANIQDPFGLVVHSLDNASMTSLSALGCYLVRRDLSWADIEPYPDAWNFNGSFFYNGNWVNVTPAGGFLRNLDDEFNRSAAAHVKILLILDYTPLWAVNSKYAAENASAGGDQFLPPDTVAWRTMVYTVMDHYANNPALYGFEVWNEPSGGFMHGWDKDNDYLEMLQIAVEEAQVVNAALGAHVIKVFATDWPHFMNLVTNATVLNLLDGAAWHDYGMLPEDARADITRMMQTKPRPDFELLVTECGYPVGTGFTADSFRVTSEEQADLLVETYAVLVESMDSVFWYDHRGTEGFSIYRTDIGTPTPAFAAFQEVAGVMRNLNRTIPLTTATGNNSFEFQGARLEVHAFVGAGRVVIIYWTRGPACNLQFQFGSTTLSAQIFTAPINETESI